MFYYGRRQEGLSGVRRVAGGAGDQCWLGGKGGGFIVSGGRRRRRLRGGRGKWCYSEAKLFN